MGNKKIQLYDNDPDALECIHEILDGYGYESIRRSDTLPALDPHASDTALDRTILYFAVPYMNRLDSHATAARPTLYRGGRIQFRRKSCERTRQSSI